MLRPLELRHEISEDVPVVPGPGARLGMVLHGEDRELPVGHAFERAVVEVQVRDFEFGTGKRVRVDRESVVLDVIWTRPLRRSLTGWLPPRCPNFSLYVFPPKARASS